MLRVQQPPDITSGRQASCQHHIVTVQPRGRQSRLDGRKRSQVVASDEGQLRQPNLGTQPHQRLDLCLLGQRRTQPPQPGHEPSAGEPEEIQRGRQLLRLRGGATGQEPAKGRIMIGPVELEQVAMLLGLRCEQHRLDCLGPGQEHAGVPPAGQVLFPGIGQTCPGVLAYRLMEAEPRPDPAGVCLQQRRGNQLLNQDADLTGPDRRCPRHLLGRGKIEPPGEHAQPPEDHRGSGR